MEADNMAIRVYPPERQGTGAFDGGKYVEQRPIAFPGEGAAAPRVGPLFYWAWGNALAKSRVSEHPHQAFEILTYVIRGEVEHWDSTGNVQSVTAGGAQLIQAGTGLYHAEGFKGDREQLFQIWFEPNLQETIRHAPKYSQFNHEAFPVAEAEGSRVKTVIGEGSPMQIVTEAKMFDADVKPGHALRYEVEAGLQVAGFVLAGNGTVELAGGKEAVQFKDFFIAKPDEKDMLVLNANEETLRVVFIEVPVETDYPLYAK
jgi:quercetin 2,3-dioxygenase